MNVTDNNSREGIEAGLADLIRVRPDRALTGFAPGGRVSTHQFGTNRSVFRGRGIEFDEARVYHPGDDVKAIDSVFDSHVPERPVEVELGRSAAVVGIIHE